MDPLVTTEWLGAQLDRGDLRIADASWFLPEHRRDARAEFASAHLPGAVFLDLDAFADPASPLPFMLPPAGQFAQRMGALGLGDGTRVVLYDQSPLHTSARAWFMLRSFGVTDVAILDGGLLLWEAEGRPVEHGEATPRPATRTPAPPLTQVRDLAAMQANLDRVREQVVDARSPARFAGEEPEPRPGVEPGHIPGARNLHYAALFHADGTWKQGDELRRAFAGAGVDLDRPVVATCGSGITAAVLAFGAHLLGHDMALYDGSWSEWGATADVPKAQGRA